MHVRRGRRRIECTVIAVSYLVAAGVLGAACTSSDQSARSSVPPTAAPATATVVPNPIPSAQATATPAATATETPPPAPTPTPTATPAPVFRTGAGVLIDTDFAALAGQRVGLIAHRASYVDGRRVVDVFASQPNVQLVALFAPEHGLFGLADAGEPISDVTDPATGVPVFSLYGANRSPTAESLRGLDTLVYDLQDVGSRFYTYTSTLGMAMQAAAEANIAFVVLDRPNPLGDRIAGPRLAAGLESFIGLYPIPSVYGLTAGELATLIKNESLLPGLQDLDLQVVTMPGWSRKSMWPDLDLEWFPPSPNLFYFESAVVYPGTVLFEATTISEGRGTDEPFQFIGAPWIDATALARTMNRLDLSGIRFDPARFTPRTIEGAATNPRFEGQELMGVRLIVQDAGSVRPIDVGLHLLDAILRQGEAAGLRATDIIDRPDVFDRLAGTPSVRADLLAARPVPDILADFEADHAAFKNLAAASLLYG